MRIGPDRPRDRASRTIERGGVACRALLVLLPLFPLVAPGCDGTTAAPEADGTSPSRAAAGVLTRGTLERTHVMTGELDAVDSSPIVVPSVPSWTVSIRWIAADGLEVRAGDRVLELDNSQFTQPLEQARLTEVQKLHQLERKRADARVQLADLEFQLETARVGWDKARREAEVPESLLPRRDWQEKQLIAERARVAFEKAEETLGSTREASEADISILEIEVESARREIRAATSAIEALRIEAPADGILVVSEDRRQGRKLQVGDNVHRGQRVLRIPDLAKMMIRAWLADVDDGSIVPGQRVRCTLDAFPDRVYEGTVAEISPIAVPMRWQSDRRAFKVRIDLDRSDAQVMRPGMSVRVEASLDVFEDVWLAPRRALRFEPDGVFLATAGNDPIAVTLSGCDASACAIEGEGLREGLRLGAGT